jgi:hypothetical protein
MPSSGSRTVHAGWARSARGAALEHAGNADQPLRHLLAGQAVCRGLMLVAANVAEFAWVTDLNWQNWVE